MTTPATFPIMLAIVTTVTMAWANGPRVQTEEKVTHVEPANNGAGPLWCYGSTVIARDGADVYLSVIETGKEVPLLCNTRWQLWHRTDSGWKLEQSEQQYRQREPCPIAIFPGGPVFLSVNPSTQPPGTKYGPCRPAVLQFDPQNPSAAPTAFEPAWTGEPTFTDHSYRGFAADGPRRELLLLNIHAGTGDEFVSFRDAKGTWHARGSIHFPIRACYPQVALVKRAAHVMAIGDVVEPNEAWRKLKKEKLKSEWDYVFRRLFYAWTADVAEKPFADPLEIDNLDAVCGHISNLDLHVDETGRVHLLYIRRPYQHAFIRDAYWPGEPITGQLVHAEVQDGKVLFRQVIADGGRADGMEPAFARFHVAADGRLYVVLAGTPMEKGKAGTFANYLGGIRSGEQPVHWQRINLQHAFNMFLTNTPRGGSAPSDALDLFGTTVNAPDLWYACVKLKTAHTQPVTGESR